MNQITGEFRRRRTHPKRPIRIVLVENRSQVRERWMKQINFFPDFACSCACATGEEALKAIALEQPQVVLIDIILPQMSGVECTSLVKERFPHVLVVIFTALDDQNSVLCSLKAGADGYLLKQSKASDLRTALLEVLKGGAPLSTSIARRVIEFFRSNAGTPGKLSCLTRMEERVMKLLSQGCANKQIAHRLEMSPNTVASHLKHVFRKLRVKSRTEAVICYLSAKTPRPNADRWPLNGPENATQPRDPWNVKV